MADEELLALLRQGTEAWNSWKNQNPNIHVDLTGVDLSEAKLRGAYLSGANLSSARLTGANLTGADLYNANLSGADLSGATLREADLCRAILIGADLSKAYLDKAKLSGADLSDANLSEADLGGAYLGGAKLARANLSGAVLSSAYLNRANLSEANLSEAFLIEVNLSSADLAGANLSKACLSAASLFHANLRGVNLIGADLSNADLVRTNFTGADLTGCRVYGISAWDMKLNGAEQKGLIITERGDPEITVDNLEVAQFIYLLLNNERIRDVIDTITSKVVLILGRFTPDRKVVLDALREELRQLDYTPVVFDFEKPRSRNTLETVLTLAHMARFVIADLTDARSVLQELQAVVPANPSVPVQPLILARQDEPGIFDFFREFPWMLEPYRYPDSTGCSPPSRTE
jgi:uncharacterized protein YjbI with pentapeptide repeats